jgi:hypothetical protein
MRARSLLRTGWGPRGDSDSARGRVRATQPAKFPFLLPSAFQTRNDQRRGAATGPPFSFASIGIRRATYGRHVRRFFDAALSDQRVRGNGVKAIEGFARQVKAINSILARVMAFLLVSVAWHQVSSPRAYAAEPAPPKLRPDTQEAFERYVKLVEARNDAELKRGTDLLWIDGLPGEQRAEAYAALKRGEVKMQKLEMLDNGKPIACPGGMIHHWTGVVFIPGAKLEDVLSVLEDYDRHSAYYAPDVEKSKMELRTGDHFRVFLRFRRHKVITVVLNTEHEVEYFHDAPGKAHSRSSAVRIAEVENAGKRDEREKTPGDDGGFLWRMETWWRMEERDGGVYVQSEVASLTRDIPAVLAWMIKPFVTSIPKESLTFTLEATRKAVEAHLPAH